MNRALVTGSSGLIGSEMVVTLDNEDWAVHGVDNNMRREFFGPVGDTTSNLGRLLDVTERFEHHGLDFRDGPASLTCSPRSARISASIAPRSPRTISRRNDRSTTST